MTWLTKLTTSQPHYLKMSNAHSLLFMKIKVEYNSLSQGNSLDADLIRLLNNSLNLKNPHSTKQIIKPNKDQSQINQPTQHLDY
jgi:hypothetical protein